MDRHFGRFISLEFQLQFQLQRDMNSSGSTSHLFNRRNRVTNNKHQFELFPTLVHNLYINNNNKRTIFVTLIVFRWTSLVTNCYSVVPLNLIELQRRRRRKRLKCRPSFICLRSMFTFHVPCVWCDVIFGERKKKHFRSDTLPFAVCSEF